MLPRRQGFSKLTDEQLPRFATHVLGTFADVLHRYGDEVEERNTRGDGLCAVLSDPVSGAACALDLQGAVSALDPQGVSGSPTTSPSDRAHVGPVFLTHDPVIDEPRVHGPTRQPNRAVLEPVIPSSEGPSPNNSAAALFPSTPLHPFTRRLRRPPARRWANTAPLRRCTASAPTPTGTDSTVSIPATADPFDRAARSIGVRVQAVLDGVPGKPRSGEFLGGCVDFVGS